MPDEPHDSLVAARRARSHTIYNVPEEVRRALLDGLDEILESKG
jgi:hypothetical protein